MKKTILATSLLLNLSPLLAANHFLVIGGGGEPMGQKTIFDDSLVKLSEFKKKVPDYKTKISFNGGHPNTESIISQNFRPEEIVSPTFNRQSLTSSIDDYVSQMKSGKIKSGDQLLIFIDSHGAEKKEGEETHEIAEGKSPIKNYSTGGGRAVSLDELKVLTQLAKEKGIKLGIMDFSCFSGETLALRNENTCVITSSGPKHYSYTGYDSLFNARFLSAMTPGKSLEDVYLSVRDDIEDPGFPMISTPVGMDIQNEMYKVFTPYFYYFDSIGDKLKPHLEKNANESALCTDEENFELIKKIIDKAVEQSGLGAYDASRLRQNLEEYKEYQKDIKQKLIANGQQLLDTNEEFCHTYQVVSKGKKKNENYCISYNWKQLITINYDDIISYFQKRLSYSKGQEYQENLAQLEVMKKAKARSLEVKAKNPSIKDVNDIYKELDDKESKSYMMTYNIAIDTHKLYTSLYQAKAKADERPNPCKDFKL